MSSAPSRKIREEDLLFWAQKILALDSLPALKDFCDGVLMVKILQRVLSGESSTVKALERAVHSPASSLSHRLDNLALVDAVLRDNSGPDGAETFDISSIEAAHNGAIASALLVLYRFYCTKSTSDVRRLKVRTKSANVLSRPPTSTQVPTVPAVESDRKQDLYGKLLGGGQGHDTREAEHVGEQEEERRRVGFEERAGEWEGWERGKMLGLVSVDDMGGGWAGGGDGVGGNSGQDSKFAALCAHATWTTGLVVSRAKEAAGVLCGLPGMQTHI